MIYHLLFPLADSISAFNVVRYLTFRTIGAALTALLIAFVVGPLLIRLLENRQIGQTIREDTPDRHQQKTGTPTMGGVLLLSATVGSTLLWAEWTNPFIWIVLGVTVGCGAVGFADDYRKAILKNPEGIRARTKLGWQLVIATVAGLILFHLPNFDAELSVPIFKGFHPGTRLALPADHRALRRRLLKRCQPNRRPRRSRNRARHDLCGCDGHLRLCVGHAVIADYLDHKYVAGRGNARDRLRRADGIQSRVSLVQYLSGLGVHGRHGCAGARRCPSHHRGHHPPGTGLGCGRRNLHARDVLGDRPGGSRSR